MTIHSELLPGAVILQAKVFTDRRGEFVKTFHAATFSRLGLPTDWPEEFHSVSGKHVLRGMHFQTPPADHGKLVYCLRGRVLDVILDLRQGSPTRGNFASIELGSGNHLLLYIPTGFAHGFLSLEDHSLMVYKTTKPHSPEQDSGVLWNSFGFPWPVKFPVLSDRDASFSELCNFKSPFA